MTKIYSTSSNHQVRPNRIVNIFDLIQPDLKIIQSELEKHNYTEATYLYEQLKKKHGYIIVDLVGLANAYIHQGNVAEAESFLKELISRCEINELGNQQHVSQARLILDELQQKRSRSNDVINELIVEHDIADQKGTFRLFSELADSYSSIYNEDAEYYAYLALSNILKPSLFKVSDFSGIMNTLLTGTELCSLRVAQKIVDLNDSLNGGIERQFSIAFKKITELNHLNVPVVKLPVRLEPLEKMVEFNMKALLDRLFDAAVGEEPSFAFVTA